MCGFRFANVLQATSPLSLLQGVLRCILQVYLVRLVANRIDRRGKRLRLLRDAFFGAPHRRLLGAPLPHPISMSFWAPRAHCRRRPRATLGRGLVRGRRLLHMLSIPFHELVTSIGLFLVFQSHPDILEAQKVRIRLASFQQGQNPEPPLQISSRGLSPRGRLLKRGKGISKKKAAPPHKPNIPLPLSRPPPAQVYSRGLAKTVTTTT